MKTKKRSDKTQKSNNNSKSLVAKWYLLFVVLIAIGAIAGWLTWFYSSRALPNVMVGSVHVGNATEDVVRQAVREQAPALTVTFDNNGKKTKVAAKDLGVVVDVEATLQQAVDRRGSTLWDNLQLWQPREIPLVLANDPGVLIRYARQHFPTIFVDAKEPQIVFSDETEQFEVIPGAPGKGLDIKSFERALPAIAKQPSNFTLKLTTAKVEPLLDQTKLAFVRDETNQHLKQSLEFKLDEKIIYKAQARDIANWAHFVPETTKGTAMLEFDKAKIQQFLTEKVGSEVAAPPIDRKVVIDRYSGTETVIQQGRVGSQLRDIAALSDSIVQALKDKKSLVQPVSITTAPIKTITMTGVGKWVEIDLSKQRVTLYIDNQAIQSFLISSGTARTPTPVGEFAIYYKTASQTMTGTIAGDYFYLPHVKWVSYFNGDVAFHGTYWHSNFGRPMSHGCINMTEANAKTLYDFAPIGTKVVVHR